MLIIQGERKARIKRYNDNQQPCQSCKAFDLDVKVYKGYYHLFFIPVYPMGNKTVDIRCKNCGEPMRLEVVKKHYENITKTPFYLFAVPILFACILAMVMFFNFNEQKKKAIFVEQPQVGDVYGIRKDEHDTTSYFFLRIANINGDTVVAYHSNYIYKTFTAKLSDDDYFVKSDELYFTKKELKQMFDNAEINSVDRDYSDYQGFYKIR